MSTLWLHKQVILIVAIGREASAYCILNHLEKCIPWLFSLNEMFYKTEKTVLLPYMFLVCLQGFAIYFARSQ